MRGAGQIAEAVVKAAKSQRTSLPGEKTTARMIHTLASQVMALNQQIAEMDKLIAARFRERHHAEIRASLPGLGPILGAEFLAATGGDMAIFETPDRLAGFSGVAPAPRAQTTRQRHLGSPPRRTLFPRKGARVRP